MSKNTQAGGLGTKKASCPSTGRHQTRYHLCSRVAARTLGESPLHPVTGETAGPYWEPWGSVGGRDSEATWAGPEAAFQHPPLSWLRGARLLLLFPVFIPVYDNTTAGVCQEKRRKVLHMQGSAWHFIASPACRKFYALNISAFQT
mgnify:CR=1 FL=1